MTTPVLEVRDLTVTYASANPLLDSRTVTAVDTVSFEIAAGETLALVGASGSGKSTVAKAVMGLVPAALGSIRVLSEEVTRRGWRGPSKRFRKNTQMVFQDPYGSLNPAHTIRHHVTRPLMLHTAGDRLGERALALLEETGLSPAKDFIDRYPHALSGGQRQRVAIARALATSPRMLVADEPTASLDVSLRAGILQLLRHHTQQRGLAMLLITHDLGAARQIADRVAVMEGGRIVELGSTEQVLNHPQHPYTRALRAAARRDSPAHSSTPQTL